MLISGGICGRKDGGFAGAVGWPAVVGGGGNRKVVCTGLKTGSVLHMKASFTVIALCGLVFVSACSSPGRRIAKDQGAFDSYPAEVQAMIRDGRIDLGFTREQVRMALGKPDATSTRRTAAGNAEVWIYRDGGRSPRVGLGLGFGSGGFGTGVGVSTGSRGADNSTRVVFEGARVAGIEEAR